MCTRPCVFADLIRTIQNCQINTIACMQIIQISRSKAFFYTQCTECIKDLNHSKFKLSASYCINLTTLTASN